MFSFFPQLMNDLEYRRIYVFNTLDNYLRIFTAEKWQSLMQFTAQNNQFETEKINFCNFMRNLHSRLLQDDFSFRHEERDRFIQLSKVIRTNCNDTEINTILDLISNINRKLFELLKIESIKKITK